MTDFVQEKPGYPRFVHRPKKHNQHAFVQTHELLYKVCVFLQTLRTVLSDHRQDGDIAVGGIGNLLIVQGGPPVVVSQIQTDSIQPVPTVVGTGTRNNYDCSIIGFQ